MPKVFKYKKIILKVCDGQHRHTEQVFFELKKYFPNISLSTVYRNINELNIELSSRTFNRFDNSVIYNDYEMYIDKVVHYIKSL